jgi:hypothetical protein
MKAGTIIAIFAILCCANAQLGNFVGSQKNICGGLKLITSGQLKLRNVSSETAKQVLTQIQTFNTDYQNKKPISTLQSDLKAIYATIAANTSKLPQSVQSAIQSRLGSIGDVVNSGTLTQEQIDKVYNVTKKC